MNKTICFLKKTYGVKKSLHVYGLLVYTLAL